MKSTDLKRQYKVIIKKPDSLGIQNDILEACLEGVNRSLDATKLLKNKP